MAFVEQRDLPNFFLTLTAYDGWPQVQATLREGWGARASELEVQDLAKDLFDRQPVGFKPQISVLDAEKRYDWFMNILRSREGGPLGVVTDSYCQERVPAQRCSSLAHVDLSRARDYTSTGQDATCS